ncbi:IS607 family transposase, partial [Limosilactobacillus reuteri]
IDTSPDKELVDDLISIIHVFSCRLYGLRKYKKKIRSEYLNDDQDTSSKAKS